MGPVRTCALRSVASVSLAACLAVSGCDDAETAATRRATAASRLIPDPARLADASPEMRVRLATSPLALFRFVNQAWTHEVCEAFAGDLDALPTARLHGDAHVEQYAVTATARGLDDFDDSARGPAIVDIVRFLGSLELTARDRGWGAYLPSITDAFFDGYRRALEDSGYLPADPSVVKRLRAAPIKSPIAFLSWADSLMQPLASEDEARIDAAWPSVENYAARHDPAATPAFLTRKKAGWHRLGIGSALTRKLLIRLEGPSPSLEDDVVVEAKEVTAIRDETCLSIPPSVEAFRVVEGLRQMGRLDQRLLVALPMVANRRPNARGWWVRAWERSYRELEMADLESAQELREVAHDVGAQLGSTNLVGSPASPANERRQAELESITRLDPRIREAAHDLTAALLDAWRQFRNR